ncbi:MAG: hypothetical protein QE271_05815 [Bacteriovoracaceae bacterium]|nr:hypothetical protein [Bacteriovoracaceae bacterium]
MKKILLCLSLFLGFSFSSFSQVRTTNQGIEGATGGLAILGTNWRVNAPGIQIPTTNASENGVGFGAGLTFIGIHNGETDKAGSYGSTPNLFLMSNVEAIFNGIVSTKYVQDAITEFSEQKFTTPAALDLGITLAYAFNGSKDGTDFLVGVQGKLLYSSDLAQNSMVRNYFDAYAAPIVGLKINEHTKDGFFSLVAGFGVGVGGIESVTKDEDNTFGSAVSSNLAVPTKIHLVYNNSKGQFLVGSFDYVAFPAVNNGADELKKTAKLIRAFFLYNFKKNTAITLKAQFSSIDNQVNNTQAAIGIVRYFGN